MQSTPSAAPSSDAPRLDAVLHSLARRPHASFGTAVRDALESAAAALGAAEASLWLVDADGALACHGRLRGAAYDEGARVDAVWPGLDVLESRRWTTDALPRMATEGGAARALDAGVWSGGALAGFLRVAREDAWTEAEGAFAAGVADRIAAARERAGRERADAELRDRSRRVDEVEAIAEMGSWDWNLRDGSIVWSPEQCRLHGIAHADGPTGWDAFIRFVHPGDRAWLTEACLHARDTGTDFDARYRIVRTDGEMRWMHGLGRLVKDAAGQPVKMLGTSLDVTERVRADEAIRDSEARFRDLFEQFPDAVQVLSPEGRTLRVNEAFTRLWGVSAADAAGWNPLDEPALAPVRDALRRGLSGEPVSFPPFPAEALRRPAGAEAWPAWVRATMFPVRGPDGAVRELILVHQDVTEERHAHEALRTSEARFRDLFEQFPYSVQVFDRTGRTVRVNPAYTALFGFRLEDLAAWNILEDPQLGPVQAGLRRGFAGEIVSVPAVEFDGREVGPQSDPAIVWPRWIGGTLFPIRDAGGEVREVVVVHQDVTEERAADLALRASEESYRTMFESSNDAIFVHDLHTGAVLDANRRACELGGVTLEEMRASGLSVISNGPHPYTSERALAHLQAAATGAPQRFEWVTWHPVHREEMWVEVGLQRVTIRGQDRLLALVRDIRERKEAEQALRESEESYRTLFQHSSDAIWVHDLETGDFLEVNDAACELYGYPAEEMKALGVPGVSWGVAPYDIEHARVYIDRAIAGEPQRFEWLGRHKTGRAVWAEVRLHRVTVGGVERLLATGRDINDRKRVEEELRRANEELEGRVAERTVELAQANEALEEEVAEHEAAKEALLERTQEMEGIFRALPDLFFRLGADATILDYRAGSALALALPPELFMWRRIHEVMPRHVADPVTAAMARARESGQLAAAEYQMEVPGGLCDFEARVVPLADGTFIVVIRDETERKGAERSLNEREEHFRRLIENASDMVQLIGHDGTISYTGPSVVHLLGYTPEEIEGTDPMSYIHPDDVPGTLAALQEMIVSPDSVHVARYRVRTKGGQYRMFEARARTFADQSAGRVLVNARDITEREAAERALRESEEHFRTLIENSSDVATIHDAVTGAVLYASPAAERVLGYAAEEMLGAHASDFVHPEDRTGLAEQMQLLLLDPATPQTLRYRFRHRGGRWMTVETTARLMAGEGGPRIVANARDVTDRQEAEEAVRRNEEHFRALIENAHDIVLILDGTGLMTYMSPSAHRVLGFGPEELVGTSAFELIHPEDRGIVASELGRVIAEPGLTARAEYRYLHKDGEWRHLEAYGRLIESTGESLSVVANVRDVTDRHRGAEALRKSEEHFRALTENASDLITVLSKEGVYLYQSPSIIRVLGYTPADLLGGTPFPLVHPDDEAVARDTVARMVAEPGVSHTADFRFRHADGSWRVLESIGRTLLLDSPDEGVVVISRDVTERRGTEEALRAATEAAERANRAKSEFLSRMSHELRTPMNSILGFAQLLQRAEIPAEQQKSVQHILKAGRHLLNLINEVLEIARIEAGRHNLSLEPVRVATLLDEALGLVRPLAAQWGVALELGPCPPAAFVRADRQRLAQVLLNLLSNAIKYNRPGGRVRISCAASDGGTRYALRVEDDGRGIPAERADQLFTPFARLGAEASGVEGTGLGLALSQRLTEAMGGSLTLERTGPEGSVFLAELAGAVDPVDALEEAGGSLAREPRADGGAATLLYVEDNLANLSLVETILLSRPGWRTLPALQGGIGVELAREHKPDLVLLDLHLPDISGEEVLRRLREDARTAHIPIVVISADATRATNERLRAMGADAYLSKPIDVDEFLETVERFLLRREDA